MVCGLADLGQLDSRGSKVADYVAVGKAYHEELIAAVNDKIASYPSDRVIYISIVFSGREKIERRNLRPA